MAKNKKYSEKVTDTGFSVKYSFIISKYLFSTQIYVVFLERRVHDKTCFSANLTHLFHKNIAQYSTLGFTNHSGDDVHGLPFGCSLY